MRPIIFLIIVLVTFSCSKKNEVIIPNNPKIQWDISKVEGSLTGIINEPVCMTVYWPSSSGCDVLENFVESKDGNIISVKAYGYIIQGFCPQDGSRTKNYHFTSTTPGKFELRFTNKNNTFISHFITITQI